MNKLDEAISEICSANGEYAMYLRKSRADIAVEKENEEETLYKHFKMLKELAGKKNLKIGEVYKEVVSGESISSRPEAIRLLKDVQTGIWKGILVVEVERLARGDTIDQGTVAKSFQISDTKIITLTKTYNPNNEFDEEYFEFGLFMSRREYNTIKRRLNRGRVVACQEGKFVGSTAPFGYDKKRINGDRGFFLVENDEARIVKLIFELYIQDGMSIFKVKQKLDLMGEKTRKNKKFNTSSIRELLRNEVYLGKIKWNSRKTIKKYIDGKVVLTRPRNDNFDLYDGMHKGLITEETWKKTQEKLKINTIKVEQWNSDLKNPLASIVICGKCGAKMQRRPYKKKGFEPTLMCPTHNCENISSKLCLIEEQLLKYLKKYFNNFSVKLENDMNEFCNEFNLNQEILSKLDIQCEGLLKQRKKCCELLEQGVYELDVFRMRTSEIDNTLAEVKSKIKKMKDEECEFQKRKSEFNDKLPSLINMIEGYENLESVKDKNDLLKLVIKKIVYTKDEKAIKLDSTPYNFTLDIYPYFYGNITD